ncbi:hypothetical protein CASFOL_012363 [Castilleja foliolosa]|uniref:MATH domain-containing protein n=1 Tax=Castilleja foliolosa TaxID=1961234 RepID=A0ABD3DGV9_9LAMI
MYMATDEAEMETREASPAHFLVKIDSFSLIETHGIEKLETREFKSGKYKWRLVIYPNGVETGNDDKAGYVSVYLAITNTTALSSNWEVNAVFSICLFDHISNNYRYSIGARRFHVLNPQWGFKKFISKRNLTDPSNGYVVDDKCVFGAEVFVNENKAVIECMSLKSIQYKQKFKISNFSTLKAKWVSTKFTVGGHLWTIEVYPYGFGEEIGHSLSIYLRHFVSFNRPSSERVKPCFTARVIDQLNDRENRQMTSYDHWFSAFGCAESGWRSFMKLSTLNDPNKGYIVKDCCIVEIELAVQAISAS